jgi:ABC-type glycerol-3-phosphate transport system substrate-binding protein
VILNKSQKKDQAWEFIKWWTSDEAQTRYCNEVEATIGEAGRIPSANMSVMYSQPWSNEMYQILSIQRSWAKGVPEVPGGYYTTRHMDNAFNRTYTMMTDPRETILDYIDDINNELTKKRTEMGISTINDIQNDQTKGTD